MTFDDLNAVVKKLPEPIAKLLRSSFIRYVFGGCVAASVHLIVVAVAVEGGLMGEINANSLGFVIGVFINYGFQRRFTFKEHARTHSEQMPMFIGFALIGLGINRFVYSHGIEDFHLQYLFAAAMAILVVFVFNFTENSLITFRPRRARAAAQPLSQPNQRQRAQSNATRLQSSSAKGSKGSGQTDP